MNGTVIRLVKDGEGRSKGFGFIKGEDEVERFFHHSETRDFNKLREGQKVQFESIDGQKGPRAVNVARA